MLTAENLYLLNALADIRDAAGVGHKPMLDELPDIIRKLKADSDKLQEICTWYKTDGSVGGLSQLLDE